MNSQNRIRHMYLAFRKFLSENASRFLFYNVLMLGVMLLSYLLFGVIPILSRSQSSLNYKNEIMQITIFLFFIFGSMSASLMFKELRSRRSRITYMCFPTSIKEKFITEWIIFIIMFPICFFILSEVAVRILFWVLHLALKTKYDIGSIEITRSFLELSKTNNSIFLFFLSIQSCFVLGSVYWRRFPFIKTFLCLLCLFISIFILYYNSKNLGSKVILSNYSYAIFTMLIWFCSYKLFRKAATTLKS